MPEASLSSLSDIGCREVLSRWIQLPGSSLQSPASTGCSEQCRIMLKIRRWLMTQTTLIHISYVLSASSRRNTELADSSCCSTTRLSCLSCSAQRLRAFPYTVRTSSTQQRRASRAWRPSYLGVQGRQTRLSEYAGVRARIKTL